MIGLTTARPRPSLRDEHPWRSAVTVGVESTSETFSLRDLRADHRVRVLKIEIPLADAFRCRASRHALRRDVSRGFKLAIESRVVNQLYASARICKPFSGAIRAK